MNRTIASLVLILTVVFPIMGKETLPPLVDGVAPNTYQALWAPFDPRAEPLDVEILKEWEDDGVELKIIRYTVGTFNGQKSKIAAVYGYPKGGKKLPGLVQIHGGGQYAHSNAVLTNAKRGYATISISWAGRIDAPDYKVTPAVVKLFWAEKTDDPNYTITTDWGALDGYHAPCRNPKNNFASVKPAAWTLDTVDSPRNNPWFLCTMGARRALTFLEQQPQVDSERLGVYGHSMGGKLTVLTAGSDSRVKAAAPSCGGISHREVDSELFRNTLCDDIYLRNISCPIMFLSPANDFHGRINDLQTAVTEIQSKDWRATCAAHHNHQDTADYEVATQIWFDQHLKGIFTCPETPLSELKLKGAGGVPVFAVHPDTSRPIKSVDIFYTQHGQIDGQNDNRENTKARYWRLAESQEKKGTWMAELPVSSTENPLWVYANVVYALEEPISGAGYYYATYTTDQFNLSSLMAMVTPDELKAAGVQATLKPELTIETFEKDWKKEWFSYRPDEWARNTHKLYDAQWAAPEGAKLAIDVRSQEPNKLVVGMDTYAVEVALKGGSNWQQIELSSTDFKDVTGEPLSTWSGVKELRLGHKETLKESKKNLKVDFGGTWQGIDPEFRNLRWVL